ncbi:MAG: hypothetical protein R3B93_11515 [Bacteroidia bacterium]
MAKLENIIRKKVLDARPKVKAQNWAYMETLWVEDSPPGKNPSPGFFLWVLNLIALLIK